jgi:signal transduction histidine kinase
MKTRNIIKIGFSILFIILLVNAWFSYQAVQSLNDNYQQVEQTNAFIRELEMTLATVTEAETGQRGYFLTLENKYLEPYLNALRNLHEHFDNLESMVADKPEQQDRLLQLRRATEEKNQEMQRVIETLNTKGREAALPEVKSGRGREYMDAIRQVNGTMVAAETNKLKALQADAEGNRRRASSTFTYATLFALVLVITAYVLLNREISQKQQNTEALYEANELLEHRVEQRTQELQTANTTLLGEIKERKKAEEKQELLNRELERSNRELQDFAFVASHDLQEPLRKIQAFGDRLKGKYGMALPVEAGDYLERMQNAAQRMHILINDLLTFSRVTTKAQPFTKINLDDIAREVISDLDGRIFQTNGRVEVEPLPAIEAEPLQMRQLLQNLIGNSLKFHRPEVAPIVKIKSRILSQEEAELADNRAEQVCELLIEDNGIGFDEKYLDRIFTPFQRLHSRNDYEGTGMGLAVCRKIVERHGGAITAKSTQGQGTTFIVVLPVTQNEGVVSV